jgi:hypothetical protein
MTTYITEISGGHQPPELQVMHKHPLQEPQVKAEAAQLAGKDGPRPDQIPERNQPMSTATTWAPTRDELDEATARTADAIQRGSPADIQRAAELEEAAHNGYLQRPGADAELQHEAEREWEAGS